MKQKMQPREFSLTILHLLAAQTEVRRLTIRRQLNRRKNVPWVELDGKDLHGLAMLYAVA